MYELTPRAGVCVPPLPFVCSCHDVMIQHMRHVYVRYVYVCVCVLVGAQHHPPGDRQRGSF